MRIGRLKRSAAVLAAAMLSVGLAYSGIATIRLSRGLTPPPTATLSASVDAYLAPIHLDGDALRTAVFEAGWAGDQDILLVVAASAMSPQERLQVYYSASYLLYPARVWLSAWCDPEATQMQCGAATAAPPEEAASRHRSRYILLVGRANPFPTAPARQLTEMLRMVNLP